MRDRGEIEMEIVRDCMGEKDRKTQFSMRLVSLVTGYVHVLSYPRKVRQFYLESNLVMIDS